MSAPTGVFLSTVTSEFGTVRDVLASDLRAKQFDVTVQKDFRQEAGSDTTLQKLEAYIRTCEAVVCIIGRRSGSVPPPAASAPFAAMLPPGIREASFTQWELIFARHHRKDLFKYYATDRYVPDQPQPTGEDHPSLQAAFVEWLFEEQGLDRTEFSSADELRIQVLKTELGSVRGSRRNATQAEPGLAVAEAAPIGARRIAPVDANRLKPNRHPLIGRDDDLAMLVEEIDARHEQLVMLVGEPGIGKKALLQELTHSDDLPTDFADGAAIHPIVTDDENPEDLRQAIWEAFYETNDPSTVTPRDRLKDLVDIEALIFLPDFDESMHSLGEVLDDMADSVFCATASEDTTRDVPGEEIPIEGLSDDEMLAVFEDRYREPVPPAARLDVIALCAASGGNPGQIELLAKEARREARRHKGSGGDPLLAWAPARAGGGPPADAHSPEGRRATAAAGAARTEVPRPVIAAVAGSADAIDHAVDDGLLEEGSPKYRLNPVLDRSARGGDDAIMRELFDSSLGWAKGAVHAEIYESRAFVLRMLNWALRSGWTLLDSGDPRAKVRAYVRWKRVIQLGRRTEPAMALGGRHGAWEVVLQCVQTAARANLELASGTDRATPPDEPVPEHPTPAQRAAQEALGWALHQRGSRSLLRDELDDACTYLNEALRHRVSPAGRQLARRNLMLVPLAVVPFATLAFAFLLVASVAGALLIPFDDDPATIDITPDIAHFDAGAETGAGCATGAEGPTTCFTVHNVGGGPIWIEEITFDDDGFGLVEPVEGRRCEKSVQLRETQSCTIAVELVGTAPTTLLRVSATSRSGESPGGDRSVVLTP